MLTRTTATAREPRDRREPSFFPREAETKDGQNKPTKKTCPLCCKLQHLTDFRCVICYPHEFDLLAL